VLREFHSKLCRRVDTDPEKSKHRRAVPANPVLRQRPDAQLVAARRRGRQP